MTEKTGPAPGSKNAKQVARGTAPTTSTEHQPADATAPAPSSALQPVFRRVSDTDEWKQREADLAELALPRDYDADGTSPRGARILVEGEADDEDPEISEKIRRAAAAAAAEAAAAQSDLQVHRTRVVDLTDQMHALEARRAAAEVRHAQYSADPSRDQSLLDTMNSELVSIEVARNSIGQELAHARVLLNEAEHRYVLMTERADDAVSHVNRVMSLAPDDVNVRLPKRPATMRLAKALVTRLQMRPSEAELVASAALNPEKVRRQLAEELDADDSAFGASFTLEFDAFVPTMIPLLTNERLAVHRAHGEIEQWALPMPTEITGTSSLGLMLEDSASLAAAIDEAVRVLHDTGSLGRSIAKDGVLEHVHIAPLSIWLPGQRRERLVLGVWDGGRRIATCLKSLGLSGQDVLAFCEDEATRRSFLGQALREYPTLAEARRAGLIVRASVTVGFQPADKHLSLLDAVTARRNITHLTVPAAVPNATAHRLALLAAIKRSGLLYRLPDASPVLPDGDEEVASSMRTVTPDVQAALALVKLTDPNSTRPSLEEAWESAGRTLGRRVVPHGPDLAAALSALMLDGLASTPTSRQFPIDSRAVAGALHDLATHVVGMLGTPDNPRLGHDGWADVDLAGDAWQLGAAADDEIIDWEHATVALLLRGGFYLAAHGIFDDIPSGLDRTRVLTQLATTDIGHQILMQAIDSGRLGLPCPPLTPRGDIDLHEEPITVDGKTRSGVVFRSITGAALRALLDNEDLDIPGPVQVEMINVHGGGPGPAMKRLKKANGDLLAAVADAEAAMTEIVDIGHLPGTGRGIDAALLERLTVLRDRVMLQAHRSGALPPKYTE